MKNAPAFPCDDLGCIEKPDGTFGVEFPGSQGMTLRDWFAGQAIAGQCHAGPEDGVTLDDVVTAAYVIADAMIEKGQETQE